MWTRYKLQDFISVSEEDVMELTKTSWLDAQKFEDILVKKGSEIALERDQVCQTGVENQKRQAVENQKR